MPPVKASNPYHRLKDRPSCSLPFNVMTLTTCSIKNFFPRHWLLAYVTKISLLKCDRRQSHICFRLIGYDTKHLEYF
jgi:hypothetical protein